MKRLLEITLGSLSELYREPEISAARLTEFSTRTRCVTYALANAIGPIEVGPVHKVSIRVMSRPDFASQPDPAHRIFQPGDRWISGAQGDVVLINRYADLREYFSSPDPRRFVFDMAISDILALASREKWDTCRISQGIDAMRETDLTFRMEIGKWKLNPSRRMRAIAMLEADEKCGRLLFRVVDVKLNDSRVVIACEGMKHWIDDIYGGVGVKWVADRALTFVRKKKSMKFEKIVEI